MKHKTMFASLRNLEFPAAGLFKVLRARIMYWYSRGYSDQRCNYDLMTSNCLKNFNFCATLLPPGILAAMLRAVCNGLCTKVRFHNMSSVDDTKSCLFCGTVGGDNARHILSECNSVINAFQSVALCGWRVRCCVNRWQSMLFSSCTDSAEHVLAFAIFTDFVIKLHNILRTSHAYDLECIKSDGIVRFFAARIRYWSRDSSSFSSFVCHDIVQPNKKKRKIIPKVFNIA
jgi:hypothetical protein